jgi:hypothetical protein
MDVFEEREIANAERRMNDRRVDAARRMGREDLAAAFVARNRQMIAAASK